MFHLIPVSILDKIHLSGPYSKSIETYEIEVKEKQNETIITDFGITYLYESIITNTKNMKKLFLILTLITLTVITTSAQVNLDSLNSKSYCQIVGTAKAFNPHKCTIEIDYGQEQKWFKPNARQLKDEEGNKIIFNSMIDALNYMMQLGWKFEQAYVITIPGIGGNQNVYHYLLSK